jgi:hypothetical protein
VFEEFLPSFATSPVPSNPGDDEADRSQFSQEGESDYIEFPCNHLLRVAEFSGKLNLELELERKPIH